MEIVTNGAFIEKKAEEKEESALEALEGAVADLANTMKELRRATDRFGARMSTAVSKTEQLRSSCTALSSSMVELRESLHSIEQTTSRLVNSAIPVASPTMTSHYHVTLPAIPSFTSSRPPQLPISASTATEQIRHCRTTYVDRLPSPTIHPSGSSTPSPYSASTFANFPLISNSPSILVPTTEVLQTSVTELLPPRIRNEKSHPHATPEFQFEEPPITLKPMLPPPHSFSSPSQTATDPSKAPVLVPDPTMQGLNDSALTALVVDHTNDAVSHNKNRSVLVEANSLVVFPNRVGQERVREITNSLGHRSNQDVFLEAVALAQLVENGASNVSLARVPLTSSLDNADSEGTDGCEEKHGTVFLDPEPQAIYVWPKELQQLKHDVRHPRIKLQARELSPPDWDYNATLHLEATTQPQDSKGVSEALKPFDGEVKPCQHLGEDAVVQPVESEERELQLPDGEVGDLQRPENDDNPQPMGCKSTELPVSNSEGKNLQSLQMLYYQLSGWGCQCATCVAKIPVVSLRIKSRRGPTVRIDYIVHVQEIKPWPPSQSLKNIHSVFIQWENGERSSGATSIVMPSVDDGKDDYSYFLAKTDTIYGLKQFQHKASQQLLLKQRKTEPEPNWESTKSRQQTKSRLEYNIPVPFNQKVQFGCPSAKVVSCLKKQEYLIIVPCHGMVPACRLKVGSTMESSTSPTVGDDVELKDPCSVQRSKLPVRPGEGNCVLQVNRSFSRFVMDSQPPPYDAVILEDDRTSPGAAVEDHIGAQYYSALSDKSARDMVGHGIHFASTAAGRIVKNASFYGIGNGGARGGVPFARIAAYKVCNESSCSDVDILAAFDDAIADGVDIITISIGADSTVELNRDVIAIGAFHAMAKGVLTSHSAGNSGPSARTINSVAPWLLSVAASNTDRRFFDRVVLGNGAELAGVSIHSFTLHDKMLPLLYGEDAGTSCDSSIVRECFVGCLDRDLVRGKIVICDGSDSLDSAKSAGAVGVIAQNYHDEDVSFIVPLPAAELSSKDLDVVKNYKNSTKNPHAGILKSVATKVKAPVVVNFSSRGPNTIIPEILKPDISAPGVEILAAYSPVAPVSESSFDKRSANYSILSGTSMSCPHATGAAAYVKSLNPHWSPSAIKSALMTTAWPMDPKQNEDAEFAYGSGHIDPVKAANPGLVYESSKADFIKFLCDMGYDQEKIKRISGGNVNCPQKSGKKGSPKDLNYPSMAVSVRPNKPFKVEFHRTVTNVGSVNSTYEAKVDTKSKIQITVVPSTLSFNSVERNKSFVVTVAGKSLPAKALASASLLWSDGSHEVRSPLVVYASDI